MPPGGAELQLVPVGEGWGVTVVSLIGALFVLAGTAVGPTAAGHLVRRLSKQDHRWSSLPRGRWAGGPQCAATSVEVEMVVNAATAARGRTMARPGAPGV